MALEFDSPEDAAMDGFPVAHCRVVASRVQGEYAYVLLDTGSVGQPYLYGVNCARLNGRWSETSSGNAGGWSRTETDRDLGLLSIWGEAPENADMVRVEFAGQRLEEPVVGGACLVVLWSQPPPDEWPEVTTFRVDGHWIEAEGLSF